MERQAQAPLRIALPFQTGVDLAQLTGHTDIEDAFDSLFSELLHWKVAPSAQREDESCC